MPALHTTQEEFEELLKSPETQTLEFKRAAKNEIDLVARWSVGFYNAQRGWGRIVIGVTDTNRQVVGTEAFSKTQGARDQIHALTRIYVEFEELSYNDARVVIVHVPESTGSTLALYDGKAFIRRGSDLMVMSPEEIINRVSPKGGHDYTAELTHATFQDLDSALIDDYISKSGAGAEYGRTEPELFLHNVNLMEAGQATVAAVIMFGTEKAVHKFASSCEICYLYLPDKGKLGAVDYRVDHRQGVWGHVDELWGLINHRNSRQYYQDKFYRHTVETFDKTSVREAIINAILHRDYTNLEPIYIMQSPLSLEVTSPGGLVSGTGIADIIQLTN